MVPQSRPPILVTRPEPQATRFARALRRQDWAGRVLVSPILAPVFLPVTLPDRPFRAVILTSETAVLAARHLPGLPTTAFCVGDRTAAAARRAGFTASSARGDAADLLALILSSGTQGPLLYLHGRETRGSLPQDLISASIETHSALVYAQEPQPLRPHALHLIRPPGRVILPILSPRSAAILAENWQTVGAQAEPHVAALSPAVAEAARALHPTVLAIAARPDGDSLLATLRDMTLAAGRT